MTKQDTFKGTPVLVGDDDFVPPDGFNGFTVSPEDMMKLHAAGMVKVKNMTNKGKKRSKRKIKARLRRKEAKKSRAKNRR